MRSDIVIGVLAEFAVFTHLWSMGKTVTPPDLRILETKQKSFAADLTYEGAAVHVKSQSEESANKYGCSFLFQKTDKILATPGEQAHMAFCIVYSAEVRIKAIVRVLELVEAELVDKPKVFQYQHSKNAIYLDSVLESKIDLRSIK